MKDQLIKDLMDSLKAILPYAEKQTQELFDSDNDEEALNGYAKVRKAQKLLKNIFVRIDEAFKADSGNYNSVQVCKYMLEYKRYIDVNHLEDDTDLISVKNLIEFVENHIINQE